MPRPKQRDERLRAHVLEVAIATLEREGPARVTTRRIAEAAETSMPAVYELFGDKAGLVREVFFAGFRMLRDSLRELAETSDPRDDVVTMIGAIREFARERPMLADLMFSQPFADFDPGPTELDAGNAVRKFVVGRIRRCVDAGVLVADPTDAAHVLLALAQGLRAQERAGFLGTSKASIDRRWRLAIRVTLDGMAPR